MINFPLSLSVALPSMKQMQSATDASREKLIREFYNAVINPILEHINQLISQDPEAKVQLMQLKDGSAYRSSLSSSGGEQHRAISFPLELNNQCFKVRFNSICSANTGQASIGVVRPVERDRAGSEKTPSAGELCALNVDQKIGFGPDGLLIPSSFNDVHAMKVHYYPEEIPTEVVGDKKEETSTEPVKPDHVFDYTVDEERH